MALSSLLLMLFLSDFASGLPKAVEERMKFDKTLKRGQFGNEFQEGLARREWMMDDDAISPDSFTMMQFNILADALSTGYNPEGYEDIKAFQAVDPKELGWKRRSPRIIAEILRWDPDVIALEEVDRIDDLMFYLKKEEFGGYDFVFNPKKKCPAKGVTAGLEEVWLKQPKDDSEIDPDRRIPAGTWANDGVALLWKTRLFTKVGEAQMIKDVVTGKKKTDSYDKPLPVALAVTLHRKTGGDIVFVVSHLASDKTEKGEGWRTKQVKALFKDYEGNGPAVKNPDNLPMVFAADLNALPVKNDHPKAGSPEYDPDAYNAVTGGLGFKSMLKQAMGGKEPSHTTYKARIPDFRVPETDPDYIKEDKHTIDYIFTKNADWRTSAYLSIPEVDKKSAIPDKRYPSDHFAIAVKMSIKKDAAYYKKAAKDIAAEKRKAHKKAMEEVKRGAARLARFGDYYDEATYENGNWDEAAKARSVDLDDRYYNGDSYSRFGDKSDRLDRLIEAYKMELHSMKKKPRHNRRRYRRYRYGN